ncbi:VIT domain-containing protein [Candidatus Hydrogenedentota bacterium]
MNKLIRALCFTVCVASIASTSFAQGILYLHEPGESIRLPVPPHPEPPRRRPMPVPPPRRHLQPARIEEFLVDVEIDNQVARTTLDQSFRNPNNRRLEGTYLFPLPANAVVKDLSLYIDGKPVKCEVLEAKKARKIYEDIVRRMRDPALLEYVGRDLVKLRIFPVEPHQVRRVKFSYSQILKRDFGLTEYSFPIAARNQMSQTISAFTLTGKIKSNVPITSVYSPTHKVDFHRKGEKKARFGFEEEDYKAIADFKVLFAVSEKDLGATLATYRKGVKPGYFMLMVAPRMDLHLQRNIPKDVTFVFDTSGSMSGGKIEQAKSALEYCLNSLKENDRFNVIRFSTETESFAEDLAPVSRSNISEALDFVEKFEAAGGTAINDALLKALESKSSKGRPHLMVFLTDGKPTIGQRNEDTIVKNVTKANDGRVRIFVFGVGNTVNTHLLDKIADGNGGASDYVTPDEDIEVKVSNFFAKVSDPVLTDVEIDFGGVKVSKQYPKKMPDLFKGSQVMIIGRYTSAKTATLLLSGNVGDDKHVYEFELDFPRESTGSDFLPRLWAIRRVGHLVDEIRKHGEDSELVDEVIRLGKKYAIATPYTSLLVLEDESDMVVRRGRRTEIGLGLADTPADAWNSSAMPMRQERAGGEALAPMSSSLSAGRTIAHEKSGAVAVDAAKRIREMKEEEGVYGDKDQAESVRHVAGRTFYLRDGVWIDSEYKAQETKDIKYASDEYFDLIGKGGDIGKYLALGEKIVFLFEGKWYRITE